MDILHPVNASKCDNCNKLVEVPKHCGKNMVLSDNQWICWKGEHEPCCGKAAVIKFDQCCVEPSIS